MVSNKTWIHWNSNPTDIIETANAIINKSNETNNKISAYKFIDKTQSECDTFLNMIANDVTEIDNLYSMCNFISMISLDNKLKQICSETANIILSHQNDLDCRKDIYKNIKLFNSVHKKNMDRSDKKFIDKILSSYKKNGSSMSHNKMKTFTEIKNKISFLEEEINKSVTSFNTHIKINSFDIQGIPENIIRNIPVVDKNPTKYGILMNNEMYEICMNYIDSPLIRKRIEYFFNTKCLDNIGRLTELFYYRDRYANILQYDNFTDTCVENHVAKDHSTIKKFISEMLLKTDVRYIKEIKMLLKLKEQDCISRRIPFDNKLNSWDVNYYITKWKQEYGLDDNDISQYFPRKITISKIINIFESMFDLKIIKLKNTMAWHDDVEMYQVSELSGTEYNMIGYFYLDLYKRKHKYNQTRCINLQYPCMSSQNNLYQYPIVVLVSNILKVSDCFTHKEISTLFHEFGHIIHQLLGKAKYSIFSGTNVEYDFVEVFGLLYEKLSWEQDILDKISTHKQTKKSIPKNLINKMCKVRNLCVGISTRKQILYSYYDQLMHCSDNFIGICSSLLNIKNNEERGEKIYKTMIDIYAQLYDQIMSTNDLNGEQYKIHLNKNTFSPASWLHLIGSSSSMYYSELWSEIYATDIFCNKLQHNSENKEINKEILNRLMIYNPKKLPLSRITKYLERKPNSDNYLMYFDFIPNDVEYSFFFNTEVGLKSPDQEQQEPVFLSNKKQNNSPVSKNETTVNDTDHISIDETETEVEIEEDTEVYNETDESLINRFSEYVESDISKMNNAYREAYTSDVYQSDDIETENINKNLFIKHKDTRKH